MKDRRVVVTGIGAVSCVGNTVPEMWDSLVNGRCGIDTVTLFDAKEFKTQVAGEVRNLNTAQFISDKDARRLDSFCLYAVVAAAEALENAGLPKDFRDSSSPIAPDRVGVCIGSGIGGMRTIETQCRILFERGPNKVSPFLIPMLIADMASGTISIRTGAQGPNFAAVSACSSGCHALGESFWAIKRGDADMMISGGAEASISQLGFAGFCSMKAMSQRNDAPKTASRPFDLDRDGFVMSEGAGILVFEEYEHAKKRGAKIYGEVLGYGATGDGYHITSPAPGGEGGARAFKMALNNAGLNPEQIGYVNAHGTSTHLNDWYETQALKSTFGDYAKKLAISSTKGTMGHGLGAAGGFETIICLKVLETGIIPPTINYTTPDPDCDLDYTPNTAREKNVDIAVNTNLGFGGHNAVLIVGKLKD